MKLKIVTCLDPARMARHNDEPLGRQGLGQVHGSLIQRRLGDSVAHCASRILFDGAHDGRDVEDGFGFLESKKGNQSLGYEDNANHVGFEVVQEHCRSRFQVGSLIGEVNSGVVLSPFGKALISTAQRHNSPKDPSKHPQSKHQSHPETISQSPPPPP